MKKKLTILAIALLFLSVFAFSQGGDTTFTLKSNDLGGQIVLKQVVKGCGGENVSPQLYWGNPPEGTKSFAITMYDPDAPTGSGWWHWLAFDIPANITELKAGAGDPANNLLPEGVIQIKSDSGPIGYSGPCPPRGDGYHTYIFTIYALKVDKLKLDENANPALVGFYLNHNVLAKSSLVAYYKRVKRDK